MNEEKDIRTPETGTEVKKLGMVKKQKIMIIAFSAIFVVLLLVYFLIIRPIYMDKTTPDTEEPPELLPGEALSDTGYSILVFPHIEVKDIKSVEVKNAYGEYTLLKIEGEESSFYISEYPQAPIGAEAAQSFAVDVGYLIASRRVVENCEDFSIYGLSDGEYQAEYTLTTAENVVYTVYIGNEVPGGSGYYCRYKGRNVVYVVSSQLESTLLAPATSMMSALVTYPVDKNDYLSIDDFIVRKNGESFLYIKYDKESADKAENDNSYYAQSTYNMIYPGNYLVNDDKYTEYVLSLFQDFEGETVVEVGSPDKPLRLNEKLMEKYGFSDLENIPFEIMYNYVKVKDDKSEEAATALVMFAPSGVDGYYYAYSYEYDIIVLVSEDTVSFLEWDLTQYVNPTIYKESITEVKNISVKANLLYNDGTGNKRYKIDESFDFKYVEKNSGDMELVCYAHSTGKSFSGTKPSANPVQSFYASFLSIDIGGYVSDDEVNVSDSDEYACITVTYNDGTQDVYRFYRYGNKCAYSFNGDMEFYVTKSAIDKVIIDAVNAAYAESVDSNEENPKLNDKYLEDHAENN